MSSIADFAPWVEVYSPNTLVPNIHHAIRESVIRFMTETCAAVDILYLNLHCKEREVPLELSECRRILQVEDLYLSPATCVSGRWEPEWEKLPHSEQGGDGWWVDTVGKPNATLWLPHGWSSQQTIALHYAWTIKRDNCEVPDWIYEEYADVIAAGALVIIHSNPVEEDAVERVARVHEAKFQEGVMNARQRKAAQFRSRRMKLSGSHFFVG